MNDGKSQQKRETEVVREVMQPTRLEIPERDIRTLSTPPTKVDVEMPIVQPPKKD